MTDLTDTLVPNSDQLDACELTEPQTFTITKVVVKKGADQPVDIHLAEFPRVWRPSKSMRRVLAACWGKETDQYAGRRLTLYCDQEVMFGPNKVGGTRISHLSHIGKARTVPLLTGRGKSGMWPVKPLAEESAGIRPQATSAPTIGTEEQKRLAGLLQSAGKSTKMEMLGFVAYAIGHTVASAAELTVAEAERVAIAAKREAERNEAEDSAVDPDPTESGEMPDGGVQ